MSAYYLAKQGKKVVVCDKGEIAWDDQIISLEELENRLQTASEAERKPTLILKADKEARYDMVAQVMSRASGAGLSDIAFATDN